MAIPVNPRLLIISGTGRNSGKTTLACSIIQKFHDVVPVISLKISPHKHDENIGDHKVHIEEELSKVIGKDSARMLAAGAARSFFITAADEELMEVVAWMNNFPEETLFLSETGGLRHFIVPGIFIIAGNTENSQKPSVHELIKYPHTRVILNCDQTDFDINRIIIENNNWRLKE